MYNRIFILILAFTCINFSRGSVIAEISSDSSIKRKHQYFFLEALKAKTNRQLDVAFELFSYCDELDSLSAPVKYELSRLYSEMGDRHSAINTLKKAVELDNSNYWYQAALAQQSERLHLFELAIETYEKMVQNFPDKPELNYNLASVYAQSGDELNAINALNKLEETIGINETVSMQKFRLYQRDEKEEKAFAEIIQLVNKFPYDLKYVVLLGDLYLDADKPEKAYDYYQRALAIEPDNAYLAVSLANYYEAVGDKKAAKKQISHVFVNKKIDIDDKLAYLAHYLQQNIKDSTDVIQAEVLFKQLLDEYPQEVDLHTMYGGLLLSQNKAEEAKKEFEIVAELTPDNKENWMQLISLEGRDNDYNKMIVVTQQALEKIPETPEIYFYQGVAYFQLEDFENSLKSFEDGVKVIPEENVNMLSDFYGQIGDINHRLQRTEDAFVAYEKAIEYNPRNLGILNNYAYYLSLEKKELDKAESMSGITIKAEPGNITYLDTYAWVLFMKGDYKLAEFYLKSAINNGGDEHGEILEHYGDVLYKIGKPKEALTYWIKAQENGQDSELLKRKIETETYYE